MEYVIHPRKKVLITGINGQDGALLAEFLLNRDYIVYGLRRRTSQNTTQNIKHLLDTSDNLILKYGDITDSASITKILKETRPDEVYNLAAQSHVGISFDTPVDTGNITGLGPVRVLEALKSLDMLDYVKFYQASSSEMFGNALENFQDETTEFNPQSPYAIAKVYAHQMTQYYRETYNAFAVCGILFNHESPIRGENFVTRKIAKAVVSISQGKQKHLFLGNINARRDWGHAREYIEGMWLMMQQDEPQDFVLATGKTHSVREFVEWCFEAVDMTIVWSGHDENTEGFIGHDCVVRIDPTLYRPAEVYTLCGDAEKAHVVLNWKAKITAKQLATQMVEAELKQYGNNYRRIVNEIRTVRG